MNNKKKIYIALAILAIIILGIGIILNFTSNNEKQPAKSNSTAKYSSNDAIVELNKLYNLKHKDFGKEQLNLYIEVVFADALGNIDYTKNITKITFVKN